MLFQYNWYWSINGLYYISKTDSGTTVGCVVLGGLVNGSGTLYHISRTSTGTVQDCVVSVELVIEHLWTVISVSGTWTVVDCVVSGGLVMGQ